LKLILSFIILLSSNIFNKTKENHILSWNAISREALANTTPLNPPIVNMNIKPKANNIEGVNLIDPP
jgi:hypothetical protein